MSELKDFDAFMLDLFHNGMTDPREDILKSGHSVIYGDDNNENIIYVEYPDLERYTLPLCDDYIATKEEIETKQFKRLIKREVLKEPCYITDKEA